MSSPYGARPVRAMLLALALLPPLGCRTMPTMTEGERTLLKAQYDEKFFTLRQSMYFGPFYDDPNLLLLDPRPFDKLPHLLDVRGKPLSPGPARGIIPAGTRVRIERVDLPTYGSMLGRPILTPRFNGWVRLRVNHYDVANVPGFEDREYVMLLPIGLTDAEQGDRILGTLVGPDEEVADWLARRDPQARAAILQKDAKPGLTYEELVAAWGLPDRIDREEGAQKKEVATYGDRRVTLVNDTVQSVE